jgi:hypothetical protein
MARLIGRQPVELNLNAIGHKKVPIFNSQSGAWETFDYETVASSSITGGTQYYIPLWSSTTTLTSSLIYQTGSSILIGSTTNHTASAPDVLGVYAGDTTSYNAVSVHGTADNYFQINIKNFSTGSNASADIVATTDSGTELFGYINMGINGSGYASGGDSIGGADDAYLYMAGDGDLLIGNTSPDRRVILFSGPGSAIANARVFIDTQGFVGINTSSPVSGAPEALAVQAIPGSFNIINARASTNSYAQINLKNDSNGADASSDIVATADNGTEEVNYINMGINSSQFTGLIGGPNDAYLYSTGSMLHIGNATPNNHIMFFVGGSDVEVTRKLTLESNNNHTLTGSLSITQGITGSLFGTASWANNAISASYSPIPSGIVSSSGQVNTGSFTGSFTGVLIGTSSWASNVISASYAPVPAGTISSSNQYSTGSYTGSFTGTLIGTSSWASNAISASYAPVAAGTVSSSDQINTGSFTGSFIGEHTGPLFGTASWATTASYVLPSGLPSGVVSSSSQVSYTGLSNVPSGIVSSSSQINTGSFTGSFIGLITASQLLVQGNLTVLGTSSVQYVTSSQLNIGNNKIVLNTSTPAVQFGGISVVDSGSGQATGSLYWDSLNNRWVYQRESGATYNSAIIIAGPKNTGTLGNETGLTTNKIPVATGDDHIGDSQITDNGTTVSITNNLSVGGSITASNGTSTTISASNITNGIPTSNAWQTSLNGSYFNNFTSNTNVSEILRFVAGLLSASAPDAAPNTKTFSTVTANQVNTTTGTVTVGNIPSASSNTTINYLTSKGFAQTGSTIFAGIGTIYTATNYGYTYTSVAAGSTTVSSSADAQLFGLGQLAGGVPTTFNVSGSFIFKFKDNSTKTDTATSASQQLITQTGAGTTSGVTLAKINTVNPAVIPGAYQDGKFAATFAPSLYTGSATTVSSSGYVHFSASISIASGSGLYNTPVASNNEIFWAPLATISTNVGTNTITVNKVITALTATSRSLSGAPYLSGSTYSISGSVTGSFNPLYYANTGIASITPTGTGVTLTSGVTTVSTAGGTIQTANAVYDSTGVTARATSTVPFETDTIKVNALTTFAASTNTNIGQSTVTPTTFTLTTTGLNKAGAATSDAQAVFYHTAGTFGQPAASGSLAYWGRNQGTDTSPSGSSTSVAESFLGENHRIQLTDNILSFTGTAWNTGSVFYNLGATDLQVKPGYLVTPGGSYGYWITNPSSASVYKYYVRRFQVSPAATKTSMTLNLGRTLVDWQTATTDTVSVLILFESSNSSIYTPARLYDPTKTTSNFVTNITANTDGQNPFGSQIALYGNSGGSVATTTYTVPIRNADGMFLNATYDEIYVLVRYNGNPVPVSTMTVTFS